MLNLPSNIITEKNKLSNDEPFLVTLEISFDGGTETIYLVNNNEDITVEGQTFVAFPFKLDPVTQASNGELSSVTIQFANVSRYLQAYLEDYDGGINSTVIVRIFHNSYRTYANVALSWSFKVLSAQSTDEVITFTLGARNPLLQMFPNYRYISRYCKWKFKSVECKYAGAGTSCGKRWDDCEAYNNSVNFGGYIGLKPGSLRLGR
jgi:phage-related protein